MCWSLIYSSIIVYSITLVVGLSHAEKIHKDTFYANINGFYGVPPPMIIFFSIHIRSRLRTFQRPPPVDVWCGWDNYDGIACATNMLMNTDKRIQLNVSNKNGVLHTWTILLECYLFYTIIFILLRKLLIPFYLYEVHNKRLIVSSYKKL